MPLELTTSPLDENRKLDQDDIFEHDHLVKSAQGRVQDVNDLDSPQDVPEGFDELPIELVSLIDRYELYAKYPHIILNDFRQIHRVVRRKSA